MDHDDAQVGRILSRREVLASLGVTGLALSLPGRRRGAVVLPGGMVLPACVVRPAQTEGPYFTDVRLDRRDIRSDPTSGTVCDGAPLRLVFQVSRLDGSACAPMRGAMVDVWQCDAAGVYSDVKDINGRFDTTGRKFLRGHQLTGPDGRAEFVTIYPGWYQGRTVHIHFKIRTDPGAARGTEFTSQLYFDDDVTDRILAGAPYASRGPRSTRNERDGIFQRGGRELMLAVTRDGDGWMATFDVGLRLEA